ncbi:fructose symporter [Lodderomyces elongisporus]|uniref:Major facilitator superfamily (MFS) profile domain-containing protein n=1 Tax=Lodderomyces elongisporus (strain ATCC 11503 / CBS 2605 / JCM 1781 / NBRC 1676 / NRRL YB-4239) TaxID=379508 RepID=A5DSD6_LODEL|nr:fructose symporter [Lodderomyces elongisporus]EDK42094.1 hypothetical protein LELG_00272 [Lodderomyces elongisporus NRRL YB-4239]WLF76565.1 fructose symporter [Lodderomyces elongisporus]
MTIFSDSTEKVTDTIDHQEKIQFDHDEGSYEGGAPNFDLDEEIEKYKLMGEQQKSDGAFLTHLKRLEFPIKFKNVDHMTYFMGGFASFAGILSGVDQSIISGAIKMNTALHLTDHQNSLVSALMPLGAVGGSVLISVLAKLGRKNSLLVSILLYTIGAIMCAAAPIPKQIGDVFDNTNSTNVLYAGRFILGLGVGIEGGTVGVYLAEAISKKKRGGITSAYQLFIAVGEVLGFAIAAIFINVKSGWRYMLGSSIVFSTILFLGMLFLPESPRFVAYKGNFGEAYNIFTRLRDMELRESKIEFIQMIQAVEYEREKNLTRNKAKEWMELFTVPRNRRALVYGAMMVSLGQLTGINAVMYYMSTLMKQIGFSETNAIFMSLVGGASLMFGTIPAILYMDRFGRRIWGYNLIGFLVGLVLVGVGYLIPLDTHKAAALGVYLTGIILYEFFFGSYACLTWVVPSESFPINCRNAGMTICSALLYLWAFTVTYNFNRMKVAMTYTGLTIGFYGGIAFLGLIYQLLFMPETKGKTLEEIDEIFEKPTRELVKENVRGLKRFWSFK